MLFLKDSKDVVMVNASLNSDNHLFLASEGRSQVAQYSNTIVRMVISTAVKC